MWQGGVLTVGGTTPGFADGIVKDAKFDCPQGLAIDDTTGDIYVADCYNHKIRKISAGNSFYEKIISFFSGNLYHIVNPGAVTTVAGTGEIGDVNGEGTKAKFCYPYDVKINYRDGSLLVADTHNNKIRKISKQGTENTCANTWPLNVLTHVHAIPPLCLFST